MTAVSTVSTTVPDSAVRRSSTASLGVWFALQLLAIVLAAARVPLAAQYPEPPEQLAPHLLLCAQVIAASLLFPWLLRDLRTTVQVLATAIPFQFGAAFLAGNSLRDVGPAVGCVDGFILALGLWAPLLRSDLAEAFGVALASCLTLGGGMLRYLRVEYSGGSGESAAHTWENVTPLPSTVHALEMQTPVGGWILITVLVVCAITIRLTRRRLQVGNGVTPQKNTSSTV